MSFLAELPDFVRMIVALIVVIAMMGGLALLLRKLGIAGAQPEQVSAKRLKVLEKLPLDARRQLVLIQRDDQQHLIIMSASGETVIETGINHHETP